MTGIYYAHTTWAKHTCVCVLGGGDASGSLSMAHQHN